METSFIKDMAIGVLAIFNLVLILVIRLDFSSKQKSDQDPVDIKQDQRGDANEIDNNDSGRTGSHQVDGHVL